MLRKRFPLLCLAATVGSVTAISLHFGTTNPGTTNDNPPGLQKFERGSGRNIERNFIATDEEEKETPPTKPKRERTEVAIDEIEMLDSDRGDINETTRD